MARAIPCPWNPRLRAIAIARPNRNSKNTLTTVKTVVFSIACQNVESVNIVV